MADKELSQLTAADALDGTEILHVVQGGNSRAATAEQVKAFARTLAGRGNFIINGMFDVWQRATTQTSSGYGSADRWENLHNGSSKTVSQQVFALGQTDVPGNPTNYCRTVVTSVSGAANFVRQIQKVESVKSLAGRTATVTFWAKADSAKDIAADLTQHFGSGGSPSSDVTGIGVQTFNLTTAWQKFSYSVAIPSISGKTLGTNNDDYLSAEFWFDAGSDFNARTNSLGQQSGTFDIANVSIVEGDWSAHDWDTYGAPYIERTLGEEIYLCKRYYEVLADETYGGNSGTSYATWWYAVEKRSTPAVSGGFAGVIQQVTKNYVDCFRTSNFPFFQNGFVADSEL